MHLVLLSWVARFTAFYQTADKNLVIDGINEPSRED